MRLGSEDSAKAFVVKTYPLFMMPGMSFKYGSAMWNCGARGNGAHVGWCVGCIVNWGLILSGLIDYCPAAKEHAGI